MYSDEGIRLHASAMQGCTLPIKDTSIFQGEENIDYEMEFYETAYDIMFGSNRFFNNNRDAAVEVYCTATSAAGSIEKQIAKALEKEGEAILHAVRKGAYLVALCVEGKQISSEELADLLAQRAGSGAGDVAFVIGSSHGLDERVKRAAQARISLGRITLPHQLARLVMTEQLYRACTINAGMKYHK